MPKKPAAPSKPAPKSTDPYANYSTAESLGITYPDAERARAEAERRQKEGVVGEWEFVPVETTPPVEDAQPEASTSAVPEPEVGQKREAPPVPPDSEDSRHFKLKKKKLNTGLGEIYDPGLIPIKLKAKKEEPKSEDTLSLSLSANGAPSSSSTSGATALPKWSARGWNKPGEVEDRKPDVESLPAAVAAESEGIPSTEPTLPTPDDPAELPVPSEEQKPDIKNEDLEPPAPAPSSGGLFRKRKMPAGGSGSRGRRF